MKFARRRSYTVTLFLLCLFGCTALAKSAASLAEYQDVVETDDYYLAVGKNGVIAKSWDAKSWTRHTSGTNQDLTRIAWSGSIFVAIGSARGVLTSANGESWSQISLNPSGELLDVLWSGQFFVIFQSNGIALTSINGTSWVARPLSDPLLSQVIVGSHDMVPLNYGSSVIKTPDGLTWAIGQLGITPCFKKILWQNEGLVVANPPYAWAQEVQKIDYQEWLMGLGVQGNEHSHPSADVNNNGIVNLLEYALGLQEPESGANGVNEFTLPLVGRNDTGTVALKFRRPGRERGDVQYVIEASPTLAMPTWSSIAQRNPFGIWTGSASVNEVLDPQGDIQVAVELENAAQYSKYFLRLRVELLNSES